MSESKVYALIRGENGEGGDIVAIFREKQDAVDRVKTVPFCFPGGWVGDEDNGWDNGCDYLVITEHEVE